MDLWPLLIVPFEANGFVFVLPRPAMDGIHELRVDSLASKLGQDAVKPGEIDGWLELKAEEKADWLVLQPGHKHKDIVAAAKAAPKRIDVAQRPENLVIERADDGHFL